jgi:hypothetical protein
MDANPSSKRRRPDESRDEDFYFSDGNIIISANHSNGDKVFFRVHMSLLSTQSPLLRNRLALPSASVYDGIPTLHVDDNAKEFKNFVQATYNPW